MANLSTQQLQQIANDWAAKVAKLLGVSTHGVQVTLGGAVQGAAMDTVGTHVYVSRRFLQSATEEDVTGAMIHEIAHTYHEGRAYDTPDAQSRQETYADAVRWALWQGNGGINNRGWTPSAASVKLAWKKGWTQPNVGGGATVGVSVNGSEQTPREQPSPRSSPQPSTTDITNGAYGRPGGERGGSGGHTTSGISAGGAIATSTGGGKGGRGTGSVTPDNPYMQDIYSFVSGSKTRNQFSQEDWDGMLAFTHQVLQQKGEDIPGGQPLELFAHTYAAFKMAGTFQDAFAQGVAAKVWTKDDSGWNGYVYTDKVGEVGSGIDGAPPPNSKIGQLPPKVPGAAGTRQDMLNNEANMELWLQKAGIPVTPEIQGLIDEAGKKGWNVARFQLAVEDQTKQGQAYLDQLQAYKESAFAAVVSSLQMGDDKNTQQLISEAATHNWSTDQFTQALYDTPEFHKAFPGIFEKDGSLKMQPSQYLANQTEFQAQADRYGLNMADKRMAWLFRNDVSPQEFADRAQAVQTLRDNNQYFQQFNQQLKSMGQKQLSKGDQFKFIMGEGNAEWYKLWQDTSTRYAGTQAGIGFGQQGAAYTNIGEKQVEKIAGKGFDVATMQKGFADLASKLQTTLPESQLEKGGVTKRDLVELEFGGPRSAAIQEKVDQLTANLKSYQDYQPLSQGANPNLGANQGGSQQKNAQGP